VKFNKNVSILAVEIDGVPIDCCSESKNTDLEKAKAAVCLSIEIPKDDAFFKGETDCMNFKRSKVSIDIECQPGTFQQINQITHWLDGSNIYGSSLEESNLLRTFQDGLLKIHEGSEGAEMLPKDKSGSECAGDHCYHAGIFIVFDSKRIIRRILKKEDYVHLRTVFVKI
jgi:peroxidase